MSNSPQEGRRGTGWTPASGPWVGASSSDGGLSLCGSHLYSDDLWRRGGGV